MGFIRPATPGFLLTLVAAILLAIVSFSVPLIKSVYFLEASLTVQGIDGTVKFGTLGYCMTISGTTTCSNATVGYEMNVNALVGDNTAIQVPTVVVKWLTYALVLHIVAFAFAGIAALFGLLAHVREMAMTCFSSCISGFGATVALIAFIFDIVVFFVAKSRMNSVSGGSAAIGNAVWLTLTAALLLFFSGCFYGIGRCCIKRRDKDLWGGRPNDRENGFRNDDRIPLDVVKEEADRKARQARGEVGLPRFHEFEPLKKDDDMNNDEVSSHSDPYRERQYPGGYARDYRQISPPIERQPSIATYSTASPAPLPHPSPQPTTNFHAPYDPPNPPFSDPRRTEQLSSSTSPWSPTGGQPSGVTNAWSQAVQPQPSGASGPWSPTGQLPSGSASAWPPIRQQSSGTSAWPPRRQEPSGYYSSTDEKKVVLSPPTVDDPPRYDMYGVPR